MTPMKHKKSCRGSLFGEIHEEDAKMKSLSPPTTNHTHLNTRLFDGANDNDISSHNSRSRYIKRRPGPSPTEDAMLSELSGDDSSILRTLDMNLSSTPSSHRRKRPSDQRPGGREQTFTDSDDDDNMFLSPRISPSYRTIDGRTVTSKNPFSPYTPSMMTDDASTTRVPPRPAPSFPMSFEGRPTSPFEDSSGSVNEDGASHALMVLPRHSKINLQRRDQKIARPDPASPKVATLGRAPSDGYPDRQGRYSFTGSPIEEIEILEADPTYGMGTKVRRLNLNDQACGMGETERPRQRLFVLTNSGTSSPIPEDGVSPTDVMSFPAPPTPTKPSHKYTPVSVAPPPAPSIERRNGARARAVLGDDRDDGIARSRANDCPKSRFNEDFDVIGQLGTGSFGTVYKCLSRLDGCMYAVKAAKRKAKGVADRDRMLKEVYALAALSDQADTAAFHIVRYHQAWMEENRLYIQTELCTSTLQTEIDKGMPNEARRYKLLREMLLALEFIHRNGMVHLDIKPENIFIKNDQYKLGDFGLVSKISNRDVEEGDSRYMSMELLSGHHEDLTKSDIFSLGATMYEICLGQSLPTDGEEWQMIRASRFALLNDTSYELELIIKEMMDHTPSERPGASELLKRRPLLSDEQKQLIEEKNKVLEANMALALQTQMMKKIPSRGPSKLMRSNTWNGTLS